MGEATLKQTATITVDGPRTLDATEAALQQLRTIADVPGDAKVTIAGTGPGRFMVSAEWLNRGKSEPAPDFREANLEAVQEQIDNPLGLKYPGNAPRSEKLQP